MATDNIYARYQDLQSYVGWSQDDARRVAALTPGVEPHFVELVDDFYHEIDLHPSARKVITGGPAQVERLKNTLIGWLRELFSGQYDSAYVERRWKVGLRHVEIGLDQVYTNAALSRLRSGLIRALDTDWQQEPRELVGAVRSLNKLLDLDLAIIEDAYQTEYHRRQQQNDRLATIGQVAGGVAHELRNPLNVVKTSVYYLLNAKRTTDEKRSEHLQRIERQVGVADAVITTLTDFARLPLPDLQPISVIDCIREVLESHPARGDIKVTIDCDPQVPPVLGDYQQLRIVFANLIRNALDAMSGRGSLSIAVRPDVPRVAVSVSDTGVGIRPEDLGRIMEPLYSTKSRGIGLGLAITRAILEKHSSTLTVNSEPGRGSTFTVCLVAAQGPPTENVNQ